MISKIAFLFAAFVALFAVSAFGTTAVSFEDLDPTRPYALGPFGEHAVAFMHYENQIQHDLIIGGSYKLYQNLFSPYFYNSEGQIFDTYWRDSETGQMVKTEAEFNVWYYRLPTSAGVDTVFLENFEPVFNFSRCKKLNPYRPPELRVPSDINKETRSFIIANAGPVTPSQGQYGCDLGAHTIFLALHGDGAVMETRLVPKDGKTDYDVADYLDDNGYEALWIVDAFINQIPGFPFLVSLPDRTHVTTVYFYDVGARYYEVSLLDPNLFTVIGQAIYTFCLSNPIQGLCPGAKRSIEERTDYVSLKTALTNAGFDLVKLGKTLGGLIDVNTAQAYKTRFSTYPAEAIDLLAVL